MPQYYSSTNAITGSNSTQNLISIENPLSSTITVLLRKSNLAALPTATTSSVFLYHFGRTTATPTSGTLLDMQLEISSDPAPQAIVRQNPTASAISGSIWSGTPGIYVGSILGGLAQIKPLKMDVFDDAGDEDNDLVLLPGEAVLLSADANATLWTHICNVIWSEF